MTENDNDKAGGDTVDQLAVARFAMKYLRTGEVCEKDQHMGFVFLNAAVRAHRKGLDDLAWSFFCGNLLFDHEFVADLDESLREPFVETLFDAWSFVEGSSEEGELDHQAIVEGADAILERKAKTLGESVSFTWSGERVEWLPEKTAAEFAKVRAALMRLRDKYSRADMRTVRIWLALSGAKDFLDGKFSLFTVKCVALAAKASLALPRNLKDELDIDALVGLIRIHCGLIAVINMDLPPIRIRGLLNECGNTDDAFFAQKSEKASAEDRAILSDPFFEPFLKHPEKFRQRSGGLDPFGRPLN